MVCYSLLPYELSKFLKPIVKAGNIISWLMLNLRYIFRIMLMLKKDSKQNSDH